MSAARRLVGGLMAVCLGVAVPAAAADVITDWNTTLLSTIAAAPAVPGPARIVEIAKVHIAMHDAVQAIQQRYETYCEGITPTSGSVIAAASKAARDMLVNLFPPQTAAIDATYQAYLAAHQIAGDDPGIAAGAQAAAALIQKRVGDGTYPVPAPAFLGSNEIGKWRPTVLDAAGQPAPMASSWMANAITFAVEHTSQFFSGTPPQVTSRQYTEEYNEVKALGRNVGSTRTPEQTALAIFYSDNPLAYWNRSMRQLVDRHITDPGDSARMFALVNMAIADALFTSWQSKVQWNVWRPVTAIQLGESDGNRRTVGDPTWQPFFATPNYPDYTSGANSVSGAATEMLRLFFRTDRVPFTVIGANSNRDYMAFSEAADDVVEGRILMGIHFRFADVAARESGQRVARWAYKYYLRSLETGDEFPFVEDLDVFEEIGRVDGALSGQDNDDAELP
jgi:hypothetical protein